MTGRPPTVVGDGETRRDLLYVDDAAEAIRRLVLCDKPLPERLNLAAPDTYSLNEIAHALIDVVGFIGGDQVPQRPPEPSFGELRHKPAHRDRRKLGDGFARRWAASRGRARCRAGTRLRASRPIVCATVSSARIQVGGAGGAPGNNVISCLRDSPRDDYLIGQSSSPADLFLAAVDEQHLVPGADDPAYEQTLLELLGRSKPDLLLVQHDFEVRAVSRMRERIIERGVAVPLPAPRTVEVCVDKHQSYEIWADAGLPVPATMLLKSASDLEAAIAKLGPEVWLRAIEGGGGSGAIATSSLEFGTAWIERFDGWGQFTAASMLGQDSVTWQSLWWEGELIVAQTRRRYEWAFSNRAPAG